MTFSFTAWLVSAVAILLTGVAKGGFGGVFGGIAVPLMSLVMPPEAAAALTLPLLCLMDLSSVKLYWRRWDGRELKLMLSGALLGIGLGALAFGLLPAWSVKLAIGLLALLFAAQRLWLRFFPATPRPLGPLAGRLAGLFGGLTSTLAHAGGPPVLVYLFSRPLPKERFVATLAVFFTVVNLLKLLPYLALQLFTPTVLWQCLLLAPLVPLGVWLGVHLQRRLPEQAFFSSAVALLALSGAQLVYSALA
ncbi:sulfite exporter TauE/SafE family protein [Vogesella facilis]|uniref:Probable membrane transporter protein n=1 Tax=Vogesella facilis TaxID=1655232 RepID=A0ABV7RB63_9NEIS